jgi:hypothetical protein
VIWLGSILLLAVCGGQEAAVDDTAGVQPASGSAVSTDPCALVTGTEAEQAFGASPAAQERPPEANNENLATCRYTAPKGNTVAVLVVMVPQAAVARQWFDGNRQQPLTNQAVTGVGDDAFWVGDLNTLYVLRGNVSFSIGGDVTMDQARQLALTAVGRIGG